MSADTSGILVQFASLSAARAQMDSAMEVYEEAVENLRQAMQRLAECWEGEGQIAFVENQGHALDWYQQIGGITREISALLEKIRNQYEVTEDRVTSIIRS